MTHIMPRGWHVSESIFHELDLYKNQAETRFNPCLEKGTQWTEWSTCIGCTEGAKGTRHRSREVVFWPDTNCLNGFLKQIIEAAICDNCDTTVTTPTPTTTTATTNVNPCPLKGTEWIEWSTCTVGCLEGGSGTRHRTREVVVWPDSNCQNGKLEQIIEAVICDGCEPTSSPTTPSVSGNISSSMSPGVPVLSAQVVECPLEFVEEDMEIKVLKSTEDDVHGYQAINMRNPISRLSISEDEGKTWVGLSQKERSAAFLHPNQFNSSLNITIRVEGWMGGSNVQVKMGPMPFPDGAVTLAKGNNVCRGNPNDHIQVLNCWQALLIYQWHLFMLLFLFRQLQAHLDSLDSMEHLHSNLRRREEAAHETCGPGQRKLLHEREGHNGGGVQHTSLPLQADWN